MSYTDSATNDPAKSTPRYDNNNNPLVYHTGCCIHRASASVTGRLDHIQAAQNTQAPISNSWHMWAHSKSRFAARCASQSLKCVMQYIYCHHKHHSYRF